MAEQHRNIVLFLGAGFSADADLPVMRDFGQKGQLKQFRLANDQRSTLSEFVQAATIYEEFRQLCIKQSALSQVGADNIEDVFSTAEVLAEAGDSSIALPSGVYTARQIKSAIQLWIWKVYHQLPFYNLPHRKPIEATYTGFFRALRASAIGDRVTVVTTNYDIVFEWLAWSNGFCCSYPVPATPAFSVGSHRQRFTARAAPAGRSLIPVCKLHGSINYFADPANPDEVLIADDISDPRTRFLETKPNVGRPTIMYVEAVAELRRKYGSRLMPTIVPPTYAKLGNAGWLRAIWAAALEALRRATEVIFIGYSMPASDGFMRALIVGALAIRESPTSLRIRVIDGCPKVHRRYRKMFGTLVHQVRPAYLAQAVPELLPAVFRDASSGRPSGHA